jgi:hypothetical protein
MLTTLKELAKGQRKKAPSVSTKVKTKLRSASADVAQAPTACSVPAQSCQVIDNSVSFVGWPPPHLSAQMVLSGEGVMLERVEFITLVAALFAGAACIVLVIIGPPTYAPLGLKGAAVAVAAFPLVWLFSRLRAMGRRKPRT